ncbi:MAG TPA: NAD-dependent epimerase/dehydratase family protein, partial [Devosia sp.]|nr:NAD-dependent epimerase/dehydratase family protein [Devosia sp.]
DLIRPAVEGTARALDAALAADVERIVLTSSMVAITYGHPHSRTAPYDESDWTNDTSDRTNAYGRSKTRAERKAWEMMKQANRTPDLAVINPSFILGPLLNRDPGTSGALIMRFLNGSLPAAPRISFPCVDVRDVAKLHVHAMTSPEAGGQRHLAASNILSMMEMARVLKQHFPAYASKLPRFEIPDWLVRIYALFDADARDNVGELGQTRTINAARARKLLGHDFIPSEDSLVALARSIVDQKLI